MTTSSPRKKPRRQKSEWRVAAVFLTPLALIYLVYFAYSIVQLIITSTKRVGISFLKPVSVGFDNFAQLLTDPIFGRAILNNILFAAISIGAAVTIAFFIATALAIGVKGRKLFYVVFLLPALIPVSLVATVFGAMFQERFGVVNQLLRGVGLDSLAQPWLTTPGLAFIVVSLLFVYLIGLPIMYYTADLSAFPTEVLEAALLDGAGTFRTMRSVIYPMLGPTHVTVILALMLGSFRALEQVLFSTGGGPGHTTEIVGNYIYTFANSGGKTLGYVAAASIIVLVIAIIIALVQLLVSKVWKARA